MDSSNYPIADQSCPRAQGGCRGRRPRKNKTLYARGAPINKYGNISILGNLRGSQHRLIHRALQHNYYSALFEGDKDIQTGVEDHDRLDEYDSLPKPLFVTNTASSE